MVDTDPRQLPLREAFTRSGLSLRQLYSRQLDMGGALDRVELEAALSGLMELDGHQHNVLAQVLNEAFMDARCPWRVPCRDLPD